MNMPWEGNVRELENLIMRGILFSTSDEIFPFDVGLSEKDRAPMTYRAKYKNAPYRQAKEQTLNAFNHTYIGDLLSLNKGNVTQAARQCGLERQALQQIIKRYGIKADLYRS
jgi:DNA-binding NtrC family response regulator